MPALRNPRRERFCQLYHELGIGRHAYVQAGYHAQIKDYWDDTSPADVCAWRLLSYDEVQNRLAELQEMTAKRHEVTVDSLVVELDEAKEIARKIEQPAAMVAAINAKAKITGNIVERKEIGDPGEFTNEDEMRKFIAENKDFLLDLLSKHGSLERAMQDLGSTHKGSGTVN